MPRSLLTIAAVALLAAWISHGERAAGVAGPRPNWVRTVDGWQPRGVIDARPALPTPVIHPGLVAAFQLAASTLALLAFPAKAATALTGVPAPTPQPPIARRRRRRQAAAAQ